MLARLSRELPEGDYPYEPKWDGFRALAHVASGEVDLRSRHGRPLARYFPEVVAALSPLGRAVLDGEVVVSGGAGPRCSRASTLPPRASSGSREHGFGLGPSPTGRLAGLAGRCGPRVMDQDWTALRPERVAEVGYDQLEGRRFRHAARFVRCARIRVAASCTADQLAVAPAALALVSGFA